MTPDTQSEPQENPYASRREAVGRLIAWVERRAKAEKATTPEDLVGWDLRNGREVFEWDDATAAHAHRLHQARMFMRSFSRRLGGVRVPKWISLEDEDQERAYYPVERVVKEESLRAQTIQRVTERMEVQAATLRFFKLSAEEQARVLERLAAAIKH